MNRAFRRGPRWILVAAPLAVLLLLTAATLVMAQGELLGGKVRTGDTVTVPADETVDGNLYIFAGTVVVDGTVQGDLTAFAGTVQINGTVDGDVLAAGGQLNATGQVGGDVRMAGGTLTAANAVEGDVMAAGGQVTLGSGASVGGDLIVTGGTVSVQGSVAGSVEGSAGTYSRTGTVGGSEHVVVDRDEEEPEEETTEEVLDAVRHFVILLLLAALLLWLLPRPLAASETALRDRPLASLGYGILTILGYILFVIAVILAMVLLALLFGLAQLGALVAIELVSGVLALLVGTFAFVLAIAYLADIVVAFALSRLVTSGRPMSRWTQLAILAAGLLAVVVITSLPVIGGIAKLLIIIFGLGAMAVAAWSRWRARPLPPASVQPVAGP